MRPINDQFALVRKIDGNLAARIGLDLSDTPIRVFWMFDKHAGGKKSIEVGHKLAQFGGKTWQ